jgi:hypothetical protein
MILALRPVFDVRVGAHAVADEVAEVEVEVFLAVQRKEAMHVPEEGGEEGKRRYKGAEGKKKTPHEHTHIKLHTTHYMNTA